MKDSYLGKSTKSLFTSPQSGRLIGLMKLFVYDHCPYCVKARMIFGLKQLPVELVTLLSDDEKTPVDMIGQKMLPILEIKTGKFMPESLDIVRFIDKQSPPQIVSPQEDPQLMQILDEARTAYYSLTMPRWVRSDMEEFTTSSAKKYFQNKKEKMIGPFSVALANTLTFKEEIRGAFSKLEAKIKTPWYLGKEISFNDIHLFSFLRGLSIVEELSIPPILKNYTRQVSEKSLIPLSAAFFD